MLCYAIQNLHSRSTCFYINKLYNHDFQNYIIIMFKHFFNLKYEKYLAEIRIMKCQTNNKNRTYLIKTKY